MMFRVVKIAEYCQTIVLEAASKWHPVNSSVPPPSLKNPDNVIWVYIYHPFVIES